MHAPGKARRRLGDTRPPPAGWICHHGRGEAFRQHQTQGQRQRWGEARPRELAGFNQRSYAAEGLL
jgi:hypothetical protein